ncbi:MAG: hypothetical protein NXH80_07525 [Rhodobacteraceae bacterium]|nr:hypothetical protein [Paracoccaceae bacterium]
MLRDLEHDDLQGKLIAYLDGELSAAEVAELNIMLANDPSLRRDLEVYQEMSSYLEELCEADGALIPEQVLARFNVDQAFVQRSPSRTGPDDRVDFQKSTAISKSADELMQAKIAAAKERDQPKRSQSAEADNRLRASKDARKAEDIERKRKAETEHSARKKQNDQLRSAELARLYSLENPRDRIDWLLGTQLPLPAIPEDVFKPTLSIRLELNTLKTAQLLKRLSNFPERKKSVWYQLRQKVEMLHQVQREELQGKLVAYLDGELSPAEVSELEALLSCDADLRGELELYRQMSDHLKVLATADGISAPSHILAKFRVDDPIPDYPVPEEIQKVGDIGTAFPFGTNSIKSRPKKIPSHLASVKSSRSIDDNDVKDFAARSEAKHTRTRPQSRFFTRQSIMQMAAALVLGIFVGPQIFHVPGPQGGLEGVGAIQLRSGDNLAAINEQLPINPVSLLALSDEGIFDRRIEPGGVIEAGKPFVLRLNAPLDGIVRVYDVTRTKGVDASLQENRTVIYQGPVTLGDRFALPEKGAFSLSDQTSFALAVIFEGASETYEASFSFFVD